MRDLYCLVNSYNGENQCVFFWEAKTKFLSQSIYIINLIIVVLIARGGLATHHVMFYKPFFSSSPHLVEVRERIRINGRPLSKDAFSTYFWDCYKNLEDTKVSHCNLIVWKRTKPFFTIIWYFILICCCFSPRKPMVELCLPTSGSWPSWHFMSSHKKRLVRAESYFLYKVLILVCTLCQSVWFMVLATCILL